MQLHHFPACGRFVATRCMLIVQTRRQGSPMQDISESVSQFLLQLYQDARRLPPEALQQEALQRLNLLIPFEFAAWGGGTAADRQISSLVMLNQSHQLFSAWRAVADRDAYCDLALNRLNHVVLFDDVPRFRQSEAYIDHWQRFQTRHMAATIMTEPVMGYVSFVGICRDNTQQAFSSRERYLKELLIAHLASALRLSQECLLNQRAGAEEGQALATRGGQLLQARPLFRQLMREEWGKYQTGVPPEVMAKAEQQGIWRGHAIQLQTEPIGNQMLLRAEPLFQPVHMSPRERLIAMRFAAGHSHKEVARELEIAPSTVRNHLAHLYRRLNVHNKTELLQVLQNETRQQARH